MPKAACSKTAPIRATPTRTTWTPAPPGGFVVGNDEGDWLELIGRVSVCNGRIRFRVPLELQRLIKDPENSYWTSLLVTSKFKLIYARAIYNHVLPEVPHERTDWIWISLDLIRSLPGKSWANFAEFKYFKRDYLEPAVKHINEFRISRSPTRRAQARRVRARRIRSPSGSNARKKHRPPMRTCARPHRSI